MPLSASERAALQALVDQKRREKTGQTGDEDKHGRPSTYRAGCRCEPCKRDAREKKQRWRLNNLELARGIDAAAKKRKRERQAIAKEKLRKKRMWDREYQARQRAKPDRRLVIAERKRAAYMKRKESDPEWYAARLEQVKLQKRAKGKKR